MGAALSAGVQARTALADTQRDEAWVEWTSTLGFPVMGALPGYPLAQPRPPTSPTLDASRLRTRLTLLLLRTYSKA